MQCLACAFPPWQILFTNQEEERQVLNIYYVFYTLNSQEIAFVFTDRETEAQKVSVTCPKLHS